MMDYIAAIERIEEVKAAAEDLRDTMQRNRMMDDACWVDDLIAKYAEQIAELETMAAEERRKEDEWARSASYGW